MKLGDCINKEGKQFTLVGIYGSLSVFKEGSDVTKPDSYLWICLDSIMIPTNMVTSSPIIAEMPGSLVFTGVQFPTNYGPYHENNVDNYVIRYQGRQYRFEVGKNRKLVSVIPM